MSRRLLNCVFSSFLFVCRLADEILKFSKKLLVSGFVNLNVKFLFKHCSFDCYFKCRFLTLAWCFQVCSSRSYNVRTGFAFLKPITVMEDT